MAREVMGEEILAKEGKAQIRLTPEHGVEVAAVAFGIEGGQGAAGDEQAMGEMRPDHFGDSEGVPAERNHGVNPHNLRLVGDQVPLQLAEAPEGTVKDPGFNAQLA